MLRMKADENGGSASLGSTASKTASIFKNPFAVEKDQLIRQLFELPVRIAAVVQSRRNQLGSGSADKKESPFSIFAAKPTAREEMGARQSVSAKINDMDLISSNLFCQKEVDCATEARQDGIKEPITYGRRKRKRIEHSQAAPSKMEYTENPHKPLSVSANDSSKQDQKLIENRMAATQKQAVTARSSKKTSPVANENEVVPVLPVSTIKMKPHDVANFIVNVIRTLRHTREGNTKKLFEILSVPDFPVEKCSFLEELIQQAHCCNKEWVAKELGRFRSEIMRRKEDE